MSQINNLKALYVNAQCYTQLTVVSDIYKFVEKLG